jgi:hypothetical protein
MASRISLTALSSLFRAIRHSLTTTLSQTGSYQGEGRSVRAPIAHTRWRISDRDLPDAGLRERAHRLKSAQPVHTGLQSDTIKSGSLRGSPAPPAPFDSPRLAAGLEKARRSRDSTVDTRKVL